VAIVGSLCPAPININQQLGNPEVSTSPFFKKILRVIPEMAWWLRSISAFGALRHLGQGLKKETPARRNSKRLEPADHVSIVSEVFLFT